MSSINRRAFVIQGNGDFYTGKTKEGKPDFSMGLHDAQMYSSHNVAKHFLCALGVLGVGGCRVRELSLGVVVNV